MFFFVSYFYFYDSPCFPLYSKILEEMAYHYENSSMSDLTAFVDSILKQQYPDPGAAFEVKIQGKLSRFTRPNDSDSLLQHVCYFVITSLVYSTLLMENNLYFFVFVID